MAFVASFQPHSVKHDGYICGSCLICCQLSSSYEIFSGGFRGGGMHFFSDDSESIMMYLFWSAKNCTKLHKLSCPTLIARPAIAHFSFTAKVFRMLPQVDVSLLLLHYGNMQLEVYANGTTVARHMSFQRYSFKYDESTFHCLVDSWTTR